MTQVSIALPFHPEGILQKFVPSFYHMEPGIELR